MSAGHRRAEFRRTRIPIHDSSASIGVASAFIGVSKDLRPHHSPPVTIKVALHHRTCYTLRPRGGALAARGAAAARGALPHAHRELLPQGPAGEALPQLAAGPVRQLARAPGLPRASAKSLEIVVDLVADMTVINPFDFFVDKSAELFPFAYTPENARELAPYLEVEPLTPRLAAWIERARARHLRAPITTIDFLVAREPRPAARREVPDPPGARHPDARAHAGARPRARAATRPGSWCRSCAASGSPRASPPATSSSSWPTRSPSTGPAGTDKDFTDLHAWCEAYVPGAGWVGLDPTSGLLAGEGHIPLACTALPSSAAPVTGFTDVCRVRARRSR